MKQFELCPKCGSENPGIFYKFHYGRHKSTRISGFWLVAVTHRYSYEILGSGKLFLCDQCSRKFWLSWNLHPPLIAILLTILLRLSFSIDELAFTYGLMILPIVAFVAVRLSVQKLDVLQRHAGNLYCRKHGISKVVVWSERDFGALNRSKK